MWWFITYCIIAFAVYTTAYFYLFERYFDEFPIENIGNTRKSLLIAVVSAGTGLVWPIIVICGIVCLIYNYITKYVS